MSNQMGELKVIRIPLTQFLCSQSVNFTISMILRVTPASWLSVDYFYDVRQSKTYVRMFKFKWRFASIATMLSRLMVGRGIKWQYCAAGQVDIHVYCEQTDQVTRILAETEPLFTHCFNYKSPFDSLGFCYGLWGQESPVSQTSKDFWVRKQTLPIWYD